MARNLTAIALFLVFFNVLFFDRFIIAPGSLGFAVFVLGVHLFLLLTFWKEDFFKQYQEAFMISMLAVVLAVLGILRGDSFINILLWLAPIVLTAITLYLYIARTPFLTSVVELIIVPLALAKSFLTSLFSEKREWFPKLNSGFPLIRGFVLAIPILIILIFLFTAADPIFRKLVTDTFWFLDDFPNIFRRVLISLFLALLLVPISEMFFKNDNVGQSDQSFLGKFTTEAAVVVGLTSLLLFTFLFVQLRYLFATVPETQLFQFGVKTYSEYVTKGFWELIIASLLIYTVVTISLAVFREADRKKVVWLRNMNLVLISGLVLLFLSVFRRLVLYQEFHGLTVARVYGMVFLVWLGLMVAILVARHFYEKRFVVWEIATTIIVLILVGLINIESIIATTIPPRVNNEIDEVYLSNLSSDGYFGWKSGYLWSKKIYLLYMSKASITPEENRDVIYATWITWSLQNHYNNLYWKYKYLGDFSPGIVGSLNKGQKPDWHDFNYSEWQAFRQMVNDIPPNEVKDLVIRLEEIGKRANSSAAPPLDRAPGNFIVR